MRIYASITSGSERVRYESPFLSMFTALRHEVGRSIVQFPSGSWTAWRCNILKACFHFWRSQSRNPQMCWTLRSSENQTDGIGRKISYRSRLSRLRCNENYNVGVASRRLYWKGLRTGNVIGKSFRFCLRLWSSFLWIGSIVVISGIGKNETFLILPTPIPSSLWHRLRLRFSVFTRSEVSLLLRLRFFR